MAKPTKSDSAGAFRVEWPDGAGSYLVEVAAVGFQPFRKIMARTGPDSVLVLVATLQPATATQLAPVVSKASRPVPDRQHAGDPSPGSADAVFNPTYASRRLSPDLAGDLNALAAMTPGVLSTASGISVLGLGPTQNLVTLNGLAFPSADIPRSTPTLLHLSTTSYDPSVGWFSGARSDVQLAPGGPFVTRSVTGALDAPGLQFTDPTGARAGQRYGDVDASVGGGGQLASDRLAYAFGAEAGRKSASPATLLSADADILQHVGISADSVTHAVAALHQLGIPLSAGALNTTADKAAFLGRIDFAPYDWNTLTSAPRTFGLTGYGKLTRVDGQALAPSATPAHGGSSSQAVGALQAGYSFYFGDGFLADLRSGFSAVHTAARPDLSLPDGNVLLASSLGSSNALSAIQFGGNSAFGSSRDSWTSESRADLQFYPAGKAIHRLKLTADSRFDGSSVSSATDALGTYSYASLSDLANNAPSAFTRTLRSPTGVSGVWNGFTSVGDVWRPSASVQLAYGLRVDGSAVTRVPAYNAAIDSAFHVRTDRGPASWAVSPRVGFTYNTSTPSWVVPSSPLGVLRGGIGAFRNLMDPNVMTAGSAATGLPGSLRRLTCTGNAVPLAGWQSFAADTAAIPHECAGAASPFADAVPNVVVVDRDFRPPTSWRANFGWSSSIGNNVYSIDGTLSLNLSQQGSKDLNFAGRPGFITGADARPVYVSAGTIVPGTGMVSPTDARVNAAFGPVATTVSDLRSVSQQLTVSARPYLGAWIKRYTGDIAVSYSLGSVRARERGFDATTFGDPSVPFWSRGDLDARHQFTFGMNVRPMKGVNVFLFGHAQSGYPFTPVVAGDVNGDGLSNDRAFVFDPARTDSVMAASMRQLLSAAPSSAQKCLAAQVGRAAAPGSCEGPWSATLNMAALLDPQLLHSGRATVTVNFANVLGGLDLLAHGGSRLKGWGAVPVPDPVLYRVAAFDPATKNFAYVVNPRFGGTGTGTTTVRSPFRVTLEVTVDIAPPLTRQQLDRWLAPGRGAHTGTRLTAVELAQRYARSVPNPYTPLLEQSDSLVLTPDQISALQHADDRFRAQMDSVWRKLGSELAALPDDYNLAAADRRADDAVDAAWEIARLDVQRQVDAILSPLQRSMLSGWTKVLYTATQPLHYKLFIAGT